MNRKDLQILLIVGIVAMTGWCLGRVMMPGASDSDPYVVIYVDNEINQQVPLEDHGKVIIDREGRYNEIWTSQEGVRMHTSNCCNQDCIFQGEVNLSNRNRRPLGAWIICLPNGVAIELMEGDVH